MDSGAGRHIIGRQHLTEEQLANLQDVEELSCVFANGVITSNKIIIMHLIKYLSLGFRCVWKFPSLEITVLAQTRQSLVIRQHSNLS